MVKILFVCHGNICRSPMAEFVMKDLAAKAGAGERFVIDSAATSTEEIGNPVYPPARRKLSEHGIDCSGKKAVVIGRSPVVGKPAAMMLLQKNATVTICHTKTTDMPSVVKEADIVIVAAGRAGVIGADYLRAGQTIIDVGINVNEEGRLCGDVSFADAEPLVDAITPVPGGVGSVTTSVLVEHVVDAALLKAGLDIL